jgi:hypothetical protein
MKGIVKKKNAQNYVFNFLKESQRILGFEFELVAFFMRNKWFSNKLVDFLL